MAVNLNSWSNALQGAQGDQDVGLAQGPLQKGDVGKAALGGHSVTLVPSGTGDVTKNAQIRETLFQSLKGGVGKTDTEKAFIEKARQELGIDTGDKAQGDAPLKSLDARNIVNLGRAQEKNAAAMLGKAMDAIINRVPPKALAALKATIRNQANHPDVVAFLDKYGSGGRDLRLLQRVCDLALRTGQGDRLTQAYLRGFRGTECASADPLQPEDDVKSAADLGASHANEQIEHDKTAESSAEQTNANDESKKTSSSQEAPRSNVAQKTLRGKMSAASKSLAGQRKILHGEISAAKGGTKNQLCTGNTVVFGKAGEKSLKLVNNTGSGFNCFFFSALCGQQLLAGQKEPSVTLADALAFRERLNEHVAKRLEQLDKGELKGISYDLSQSPDLRDDVSEVVTGDGGRATLQEAIMQHLTGSAVTNGVPMDLSNAAFLADMLQRPVTVYVDIGGEQHAVTFDKSLETGKPFAEKRPLEMYFSKADIVNQKSVGHFQCVAGTSDTPAEKRRAIVEIGAETVKAMGPGNADSKLLKLMAGKVATLIDARVKSGDPALRNRFMQQIDQAFAKTYGDYLGKTFSDVRDEATFLERWNDLNQKNTPLTDNLKNVFLSFKNDSVFGTLVGESLL